MKFVLFINLALYCLLSASCSLTSNTYIQANDSFVLGNNEHGRFSTRLKNTSNQPVKVYRAPIGGGTHSPQFVQPKQSVTVRVERNTALVIENTSTSEASVALKVKGDTGLSMGYKK
ncbi:MAG: hypothetical protein JNM22_06370 [Saprospiraceae bacterium]|nr:hypothetical protein [Saprospiraceae bacterium]